MGQAKISQKNQIVIPKEAREEMKVHAGDEILVEAIHGITLLMPKPKRIGRFLKGFSEGTYSKGYLPSERKSWRN